MSEGPAAWYPATAGASLVPTAGDYSRDKHEAPKFQQPVYPGSNPSLQGAYAGAHQDGAAQPAGPTNLIINYIPSFYNEENLMALFSPFGAIRNCKLVIDKVSGKSLEYAFVDFENPASALQAQQRVNGLPLGTKRLKVSFARPRSKAITNANLYIRNLPPHADDATLFQWFSSHGPIIQARVLRNADGSSRGVGFVHFDQHEHAMVAIHRLNNVQLPGCTRPLMVKFAQRGEDSPVPGPVHGVRHHHHHHHHHHGPFSGPHLLPHALPHALSAGSSSVAAPSGLAAAAGTTGLFRSYSTPMHGHASYQPLPNAYPPYGHSYPGHSFVPYMSLGPSTEYRVPYGAAAATASHGRH